MLFDHFFHHFVDCFRGRNLFFHLIAIALTVFLVRSGLDWIYAASTRSSAFVTVFSPAICIGTFLPMLAPLVLLGAALVKKHMQLEWLAWMLGQSALIGLLVAAAYKALTGRAHPGLGAVLADATREFHFGFLRGGVFWGWPSSHTVIAFAMAAALSAWFPRNKLVRYCAIFYAAYIGIGVSVTIHWLSDVAAGAIIGTVIGRTVGRNFYDSHF